MTLRELEELAEERQRDQWAHTSLVLAVLANLHRDPKRTGRYSPDDFNPFAASRGAPPPKAGIEVLKAVFVDQGSGGAN
ncbi:MAG TPA: hypothetical protein DCQ98_13325 [Planctomycetaceae bacterium]|nr:hypothetical protein [Planctomycetaceae bacterium]